MCGFAGFVSASAAPAQDGQGLRIVEAMGRQLRRRGPDDEQFLADGRLTLVFRRLSIVDCEGGRQPIPNEDDTLFLVLNGEIYNHRQLRSELKREHRFRTQSDVEVVLHLFEERGPSALDLLVGMFALAIWDGTTGRLFLARDRLGIKPLYYAQRGETLLFASELKALLAHPDAPREFAWHDLNHGPGRLPTYVRGVEALPGGYHLTWAADGRVTTKCWWSLEPSLAADDRGLRAEDYVERFADLFEDSVRLRLMADVPVGLFLSGGLDSCALAAVAARCGSPLPCFTLLERGTWLCGDAQSAAELSGTLDSPFYPVLIDHAALGRELHLGLEEFEYFVWLMDLPVFTFEFLLKHELHRFARTAVPGLKVMMIGQGADEFAGGYSNSAWEAHACWDDYLTRTVVPTWQSERRFRLGVPDLFRPVLAPGAYGPMSDAPFKEEMRYRLHTLQIFNLWHEDRTSSGQGIEARVPYLDHRLVELLASVPGRLHGELFWDKAIVRRAARRWLREPWVGRPKVPFVYGPDRSSSTEFIQGWVRAIFPAFREKYLGQPDSPFDAEMLARLLAYAERHPDRRENVLNSVLSCLGIAVFMRLCQTPPTDAPRQLQGPSPLRCCEPSRAPWTLPIQRPGQA